MSFLPAILEGVIGNKWTIASIALPIHAGSARV